MSQEEKDAALGRLMRDERDKFEQLAQLKAEANKIGKFLVRFGESLNSHASSVVWEGQTVPPQYAANERYKDGDFPTVAQLRGITEEIRKTEGESALLRKQLSEMGYPTASLRK
ncbi:MAG: hypothetical protein WCF26_05015 [Candidatus Sulfotelmatobacter sp.]